MADARKKIRRSCRWTPHVTLAEVPCSSLGQLVHPIVGVYGEMGTSSFVLGCVKLRQTHQRFFLVGPTDSYLFCMYIVANVAAGRLVVWLFCLVLNIVFVVFTLRRSLCGFLSRQALGALDVMWMLDVDVVRVLPVVCDFDTSLMHHAFRNFSLSVGGWLLTFHPD